MSTTDKKRRGRRRAGGLRKHQEIENVKVEESFSLHHGSTEKAGEGCYVSATTSNNKRYYGVMVDQATLKEASSLWFQDQADSLELNRRMKLILDKEKDEAKQTEEGDDDSSQPNKRQKVEEKAELPPSTTDQSVQKFKYVKSTSSSLSDYRQLLATFLNVNEASQGDPAKSERIRNACEVGGGFVGSDYYQYEVPPATLSSQTEKAEASDGWRPSMSFSTFLNDTHLPPFYPLANLQSGNSRVLGMLNMKRDNSGNVVWDEKAKTNAETEAALLAGGTRLQSVPMQRRSGKHYKIGVIGGGIAGMSCCLELLTLLKNEGIKAKVTLLEARSRVGGRLCTEKFVSSKDGSTVPMELGASWIHGIDHNPLAAMCKRANIDFVTASEEVAMIDESARTVDEKMDERMGQLFDDLLDHAAEDCWTSSNTGAGSHQKAIKWYASVFAKPKDEDSKSGAVPEPTGVPVHRKSTDQTVDYEIGKAISKHKLREFSKLGSAEHRMLMWNTKNVEYALGSNLADLSMKFWDSDERHAFEGDHVMLKQGYGAAVEYMLKSLQAQSADFELVKDYPVGKVEYARKSATQQYGRDSMGRNRRLVEMSDTCSVSKQDGTDTKYFDFLICAAPLGVLKEATQYPKLDVGRASTLSFQPALPFSKIDAITNVGFGLLNKVYLCFDSAFWRSKGLFESSDQCLFGNVTGKHPHHYMFFDVGKILGDSDGDPPAMLMSLISGKEAVKCEHLSDEELISEVMETLKTMFSNLTLPKPKFHRITRWGKDKFSRGSYTFLPPGATDQDFQSLQSPINGNGDSLWVEGNETMRVFFAGEHTTALHPSMAHGAMLSGQRAAAEVVSTMLFKSDSEKEIDRMIPEPLFRYKNASAALKCSLCHKDGGTIREGRLVAFKRGSRQVLVHNNCAENCPEVEVVDSKWKHVIKAVNRGKALSCDICRQNGATIGCTGENCFRIFHFSCAEDTGWRFDRDSKEFYCDLHRQTSQSPDQCDRISLGFYMRKNPSLSLVCAFCKSGSSGVVRDLLAFQSGTRQMCAHENCIKHTTIIDTSEAEHSRMGKEYRNVFRAFDMSKTCSSCERGGATIACSEASCSSTYHYGCAIESGCSFHSKKPFFLQTPSKQEYKARSQGKGVYGREGCRSKYVLT
mmetsp:Transcript_21943/g.54208  ORF Transcript_21943/g.54208 Transcript_21943/m.54208 type:complete len:1146 (+) Transcript_21943:76-3513(+)